jgi:hypothetical protein
VAEEGRLSIDKTNELIGAWTLASMQFVFDDNGERVEIYGPHPAGVIVLTAQGRMVGIITAGAETQRANTDATALLRGMLAYSGPYRIEGDKFITSVDIAWHPSWIGTEQVRFFRVAGDRLTITTAPQTLSRHGDRMGRGILEWRREGVDK